MKKKLSSTLLVFSAFILVSASVLHSVAYQGASAAIDRSGLQPFYAKSAKALWLIDSATLITLAVVFIVVALRPALATRWLVLLLAVIPAMTAVFMYLFIGNFAPAHALLAAGVAAAVAALQLPSPPGPTSR